MQVYSKSVVKGEGWTGSVQENESDLIQTRPDPSRGPLLLVQHLPELIDVHLDLRRSASLSASRPWPGSGCCRSHRDESLTSALYSTSPRRVVAWPSSILRCQSRQAFRTSLAQGPPTELRPRLARGDAAAALRGRSRRCAAAGSGRRRWRGRDASSTRCSTEGDSRGAAAAARRRAAGNATR